jgi:hypothetical protein|tara:strand:- start:348 stop:707 length:360 start_codon:yes stop_codon:yes gene_type:complete
MEIANRDKMIDTLRLEIDRVKGGVLNQLQDIGEIQKENEFLTEIMGDYKKYHNALKRQKHREENHLKMLVDYLEKQLMEAGMTESMEKQARFEQNRILKDLDDLKMEMKEIISNDNLDE